MVENKKKSGTKKMVLVNLAAMAAVVIFTPFMALWWLDSYTLHGQTIPVPDVCGMQLDEAVSVLCGQGLDFEIVDHKYMKGADENEVLEQRPVAGDRVKDGRKIELTMSSDNEPMQRVPDIIDNCSLREAEARLRAAGFKLAPHVEVPGEDDWVYSLLLGSDTLHNGAQIPVGSTVVLVIGNGEDEDASSAEPIVDDSWFE